MHIDPDFKEFLEYLKDTNGTPISRIMEIAAKEKYDKEFKNYLSDKKKGAVKNV